MQESNDPRIRVYWQPGCSSCLRAKEFLTQHGIAFESINVREDPRGMQELAELGLRSVPVVRRGNDFVLGQSLQELADFAGVTDLPEGLSEAALIDKLKLVLAAAERYTCQLTSDMAHAGLPGRQRTTRDLAYHVFMIPTAFLDAADGDELTYEHFERTPGDDMTIDDIAALGTRVRTRLDSWWDAVEDGAWPETLATYYGRKASRDVLERTAWHAAQHTRQLMQLLENAGIAPDGPLSEEDLAGLPLPTEVYDDQVGL